MYKFVPFYIQLKDFFLNNVIAFVLVRIALKCHMIYIDKSQLRII
jgi:hypothetical protein